MEPAFEFAKPGILAVPTAPGIGYDINQTVLEKFTERRETVQYKYP